MTESKRPLTITDVVLRDAHQSLLATRMRLDDMLPVAEKLDRIGYWSIESWGGATFDSCIRYLGEDPWVRIREIKKAMPNTPQQMLLRGQNLLGYRHYADDVVQRFVERAAANGVDVFRVFDAMNDVRNMKTAIAAVKAAGRHAQGTLSYTSSPVHTVDMWVSLAKEIEDCGADSIAIKDMAGLLRPYEAFELVSRLKAETDLRVHLHCHATTGLATPTLMKAIEAGIDNVDTAISSMSMTYGHAPTEAIVAMLQGTDRDTGLDIEALEEIAAYFRQVRKKYARFEGALRGVDSRILVAQVPGGMLTNMENQLREQGAHDRLDEVLEEIPRVRKDLGYIPLVTPTSQIVGTQAVLNVLAGERYATITKETAAILKGEYGRAPAPFNKALQERVLDGGEPITCRPADLIEDEMDVLTARLKELAAEKGIRLADNEVDDVLTYALFPQVGLRFLENRGHPEAFEPAPEASPAAQAGVSQSEAASGGEAAHSGPEVYTITVNGQAYVVEVTEGGDVSSATAAPNTASTPTVAVQAAPSEGEVVPAPLAGTVLRVLVKAGDRVQEGDVLLYLEAMKMETEVRAQKAGRVVQVAVSAGDAVAVGDALLSLA